MKQFTIADIRSYKPCYDPSKYLSEEWKGTVIDILKDDRIPFTDRLWVVCRAELISERVLRLFAVWCARQVQHLMKDPRSIAALDVAQRFAMGEASKDELYAAWYAARAAVCAAASDAARAAASDAARAAAWAGASDVVWAGASDSAWYAQKNKLIERILADEK